MIKERIAAGVIIDRKVVVAIGRGVIESQQPKNCEALLPHLTGSWARSMMTRMGLIHQNGKRPCPFGYSTRHFFRIQSELPSMRAYKTLTEHFSETWSKVSLTALNIPYLRWDVPYV